MLIVRSVPWTEAKPATDVFWATCRDENPALSSPYFHPGFFDIIARWQNNIEVAIIEDDSGMVALFPFQRMPGNKAVPVGRFLSDYHGLIAWAEFAIDPKYLLRRCGLVTFDFDHLVTSQQYFAPFHRFVEASPQINLMTGFGGYAATQKSVKSEQIKIRRIERDIGPLRFVEHSSSQIHMQQLLLWKSQQYLSTGVRDIFVQPWVTSVVQDIHATRGPEFSGMLSLLYAGDRLVATHFGMRAGPILHSWFPAYDPELSTYSPGLLLLLKIAEFASTAGIEIVDLGKGKFEWKDRFANTQETVATGSVELPSLAHATRQLERGARWLARPVKRALLQFTRPR